MVQEVGPLSGSSDDDLSFIACSNGTYGIRCNCKGPGRCDGSYFDSDDNGTVCTAVNMDGNRDGTQVIVINNGPW